ncbi:uncharacterized protein LOC6740287 [Drosophila simulans]|uniref:Uncharacterized protein, isoform A n=1 Tax=Drosophila simulans TaxID=7240 RepID=A0A0J9R6K6_DROSI|nr:uncharacterized protein LOC6740287 [Drosophila simulans]KMY91728.1 uncharacterized protein Dsimw501_GD15471, isoform A [Drosophila simulans]
MCSSVGLVVEGVALGSGSQYFSRMTMKREYNTKCFWPDLFCHEVANHYRDYKLQCHLQQQLGSGCVSRNASHRRRKRIPSVKKSREPALLASGYVQFRDVWPTHVHYFPRSDDTTYSSRSQRPVWSGKLSDETYNDAVRRIRSAHSCEQLRHLVNRIPWRRESQIGPSDEVQVASVHGSQTRAWGRLNYKININKCPAESPQQQLPVNFHGYLQLASSYYERGLQANIKYLQSIGQRKRNAIRPATGLPFDEVQRNESPAQETASRLVTLLKRLPRKAKKKAGDHGIWVNIRTVKREDLEKVQSSDENSDLNSELKSNAAYQLTSMCDYSDLDCTTSELDEPTGAEGERTIEHTLTAATSQAAVQVAHTSGDQRRLYEIIDNLSYLSTGEDSCRRQQLILTLPQITVTDCTAQQVAPHSTSFDIFTMKIPNEDRPPNLDLKAT